ncbi:hypothetical protein SAV14893_093020 [Streptomyces avermitilis]|uniref:Uncharacterized protein n=1 Tax=Streptomyces avermitilis TaxID=33903 RepID=A0A4D4MEA8_STRAX|nr:hypothetical protein SAV14893_093020 [Streptomyces avermitilis]
MPAPHRLPQGRLSARAPADALNLMYPAGQQWRPKESTRLRVIEQLGFDPFEDLRPPL